MALRRRWALTVAAAVGLGMAAALVRRYQRGHERDRAGFSPVMGSRSARNARLARLGARRASSTGWHRARRTFASAPRREALDTAQQLRNAEDVAAVLGEMKGALAKLGQMASYL